MFRLESNKYDCSEKRCRSIQKTQKIKKFQCYGKNTFKLLNMSNSETWRNILVMTKNDSLCNYRKYLLQLSSPNTLLNFTKLAPYICITKNTTIKCCSALRNLLCTRKPHTKQICSTNL